VKYVYICSPLKGDYETNIKNAKGYCRMALFEYGHIPIAPHIYFTQFLDDTNETERLIGMKCGLELLPLCDFFWQFGEPSEGMKAEIKWWKENTNKPILRFER